MTAAGDSSLCGFGGAQSLAAVARQSASYAMSAASYQSEALDLFRQENTVVIAERKEHRVDSIVTGIIVTLLALPLLIGGLALGIWLLILGLTGEQGFRFAPPFSQFASPPVIRAAEAAFPFFLGLLFAGSSLAVLVVFLKVLPNMFPYECRLKASGATWAIQRKLWFVVSTWRILRQDWTLGCYPVYMRGDWGYCFFVRSGRSRMKLASSGAYTPSKRQAREDAARDMTALTAHFRVPGEFRKWEKA